MTALLSTRAAEILGTVLLHSLWQGVVVAALAWLALSFLKRPAARYRVACLALLALLLWPAVTGAHLALNGSSTAGMAANGTNGTVVAATSGTAITHSPGAAGAAPLGTSRAAAPTAPGSVLTGAERGATAPSQLRGHLASVIAAVWLLGVLAGLTRLVAGLTIVA